MYILYRLGWILTDLVFVILLVNYLLRFVTNLYISIGIKKNIFYQSAQFCLHIAKRGAFIEKHFYFFETIYLKIIENLHKRNLSFLHK